MSGDYSRVEITDALPAFRSVDGSQGKVPRDLIGATILKIGMPLGLDIEGGGLAIEYVQEGKTIPQRVIFGFNELGMWIEFSPGGT